MPFQVFVFASSLRTGISALKLTIYIRDWHWDREPQIQQNSTWKEGIRWRERRGLALVQKLGRSQEEWEWWATVACSAVQTHQRRTGTDGTHQDTGSTANRKIISRKWNGPTAIGWLQLILVGNGMNIGIKKAGQERNIGVILDLVQNIFWLPPLI